MSLYLRTKILNTIGIFLGTYAANYNNEGSMHQSSDEDERYEFVEERVVLEGKTNMTRHQLHDSINRYVYLVYLLKLLLFGIPVSGVTIWHICKWCYYLVYLLMVLLFDMSVSGVTIWYIC